MSINSANVPGYVTYNGVIHGDCVEVLRTLSSESVDAVITDPPYGVRYCDRTGRTVANDDDLTRILPAFEEIGRVLKPDRFCVCFYGWNQADRFLRAWREAGLHPVGHLVWTKTYASSVRFLESRHEQAYLLAKGRPDRPASPLPDVQPWEYTGNRVHPTEKAVGILKPLVETFAPRGGLVLDPFSGSGSTLVAAALCGRSYLGIECEERHCRVTERRLSGVARTQAA